MKDSHYKMLRDAKESLVIVDSRCEEELPLGDGIGVIVIEAGSDGETG